MVEMSASWTGRIRYRGEGGEWDSERASMCGFPASLRLGGPPVHGLRCKNTFNWTTGACQTEQREEDRSGWGQRSERHRWRARPRDARRVVTGRAIAHDTLRLFRRQAGELRDRAHRGRE